MSIMYLNHVEKLSVVIIEHRGKIKCFSHALLAPFYFLPGHV